MRYPAAETAQKHARILVEASRLFRAHGFAGVSVGKIMQATGLTHGPFYNHFASKEVLVTESLVDASNQALALLDRSTESPQAMVEYVRAYLSAAHRDAPDSGCLVAALGSEIAREHDARSVMSRYVSATVGRFERWLPWRVKKNARGDSIRLLATMIGALTLARAVDDAALSDEILKEAREVVGAGQPLLDERRLQAPAGARPTLPPEA